MNGVVSKNIDFNGDAEAFYIEAPDNFFLLFEAQGNRHLPISAKACQRC